MVYDRMLTGWTDFEYPITVLGSSMGRGMIVDRHLRILSWEASECIFRGGARFRFLEKKHNDEG